MKFGLFTWFSPVSGKSHGESFDANMREVDLADDMGWETVWVTETHFGADLNLSPTPILLAAGIGARTKRLKVGTAVHQPHLTLPDWAKPPEEAGKRQEVVQETSTASRALRSYAYIRPGTPIATAEDSATADQITNGRFILGMGGGTRGDPHKLEMYLEYLEIVKQAWREKEFSGFNGKYYQLPEMWGITPRPRQQPGPPIVLAAESASSFPTFGKLGYHLMVGAGTSHNRRGNEGMMEDIKAYKREWAAAGHPGQPTIVVRVPTHIRPSKQQALKEVEATVERAAQTLSQLGRATQPQADSGAASLERVKRANLFGTPSEAIERIHQIREELGATEIMFETNYFAQIDRDAVLASMRLITDKVIPAFAGSEIAMAG